MAKKSGNGNVMAVDIGIAEADRKGIAEARSIECRVDLEWARRSVEVHRARDRAFPQQRRRHSHRTESSRLRLLRERNWGKRSSPHGESRARPREGPQPRRSQQHGNARANARAKGIVIAVAGAGATSGTQNEGLSYAASKGVFIVTSTRTGSGRIAPPQRGGDASVFQPNADQQLRRRFTIAGEDHTPVKARVLLMVALTRTSDRNELQRIFSEY